MTYKKKIQKAKLINFQKILGNVKHSNAKNNEIYISGGILQNQILQDTKDFLIVDAKDCIISPGFIDPQVNGLGKCNFWEKPSFEEINKLRLALASCGVVAFCPTIITASHEKIINSINHINSYLKQSNNEPGAKILGIHIEGIFITKYGVHESKYTNKELTIKNVEPYIKDNVILFTLAPELDKNGEAINFLRKNNILVSIGHSNATYNEGINAIEKYGLKTVTHMFNSLKGIEGFSHRKHKNKNLNIELLRTKLENPKTIDHQKDGIILALLKEKQVLTMVISDGIHVDKSVLGLLRNYKDSGHFALASDSVSTDFYNLSKSKGLLGGGQNIIDECVENLINWKVSNIEDSLSCASKPIANQLKSVGACRGMPLLGEITYGKEVNLVLWDTKKNAVKGTIIGENIFINY